MTKLNKEFITRKVAEGLRHYLTDQTTSGRFEDGLLDVRIEMDTMDSEIVIRTKEGKKWRRFLIEVAEEI